VLTIKTSRFTDKYGSLSALKILRLYDHRNLYTKEDNYNMKKIINIAVMLVLVTLVVNQSWAQSKTTDQQKNEAKVKYQEYKEKLNLTEDQSKKVDAINSTWFEGIAELKRSSASKMSKYRKFKSLNSEKDRKMKEVLTKEQFKIYKQQQQEMKDEFKERRANRE
jgi:hypothetical protein